MLLDVIDDLECVDILVFDRITWAQILARFLLAAGPTPIRQHHRKIRRRAVVELLVFVANAR